MSETDARKPFCGHQDALHLQGVEFYLGDLKERLQKLRSQHDELIDSSVELIEELDEVSLSVMTSPKPAKVSQRRPSSKIQKLIEEFDKSSKAEIKTQPENDNNRAGGKSMREILLNFERINQSHVLQNTIKVFRRAKESFAKVDALIGQLNQIHNNVKFGKTPKHVETTGKLNFQEKLVMFDKMSQALNSPKSKHSLFCNQNQPAVTKPPSSITVEKQNNQSETSIKLEHESSNTEELEQCSSEKIVNSEEEDSDHSDEEIQKVDVLITSKTTSFTNKNSLNEESVITSSNVSFKSLDNIEPPEMNAKFSVSGYEGDCDDSEFCMRNR